MIVPKTCIFLWLYRPRPTVFHYYLYVYWIYRREQKLWIQVLQSILHNCFMFSFKKSGYSGDYGGIGNNIDFNAVISNLTYSTNSITSYLSTYLNHSLRRMFNSVHSIGHFMRLLMAPRPSLLLYPISILENRMEASQDSNTANNPMSPLPMFQKSVHPGGLLGQNRNIDYIGSRHAAIPKLGLSGPMTNINCFWPISNRSRFIPSGYCYATC